MLVGKLYRFLIPLLVITTVIAILNYAIREQKRLRIETPSYIQMAAPTSFMVRWNTLIPRPSELRYGTDPEQLTHAVRTTGKTRRHKITLSRLKPGTRYYYQINEAPGIIHQYRTPPPVGTDSAFRAWVLGDAGKNNDQTRQVLDGYKRFNNRPTDLILLLGDNAYGSGSFADYSETLFSVFGSYFGSTALWPTVGNHDVRFKQGAAYFDLFSLPARGQLGGAPSGTARYYAFDHGNTHFISLDSELSGLEKSDPMYRWLESNLEQNQSDWVIVLVHRPPYSKGSHDSDDPDNKKMKQIRENFVPLFDRFNVDLVISGHSHSYERSYPLTGHYGDSASLAKTMIKPWQTDPNGIDHFDKTDIRNGQATVYVVSGSVGKLYPGSLDHPAHKTALAIAGSLVIDVEGKVLEASFVSTGEVVADRFRITK